MDNYNSRQKEPDQQYQQSAPSQPDPRQQQPRQYTFQPKPQVSGQYEPLLDANLQNQYQQYGHYQQDQQYHQNLQHQQDQQFQQNNQYQQNQQNQQIYQSQPYQQVQQNYQDQQYQQIQQYQQQQFQPNQNQLYQHQYPQRPAPQRFFTEPDPSLPRENISPKKVVSISLLALSIMAVVVVLAQYGIDYGVSLISSDITETDWYLWVVTAISIVLIGFPIYFLIMRAIPDSPKRTKVKLKINQFIVIFFICLSAMYITNFFSVMLNMAISLLKGDVFTETGIFDIMYDSNYLITIIYACIIAPIMEEIIFRKLLLNKLRRFGDVPAILITAIAFGLFHMNLIQVFYATTLGIIFAYVTCKTNTILYSILLHMMVNSIGTAVVPVAASRNIIASLFILLWVGTAVITGIVLFAMFFKKIRLEKGTVEVTRKSVFILNSGTILYLLICLTMIMLQVILPAS